MDFKISLSKYPYLAGKGAVNSKVLETLKYLLQNKVEYELRSTLVKEIHSAEVINDMANELAGAKRLYIQSFRPEYTLSSEFERFHAFTKEEIYEILPIFKNKVDQVIVR